MPFVFVGLALGTTLMVLLALAFGVRPEGRPRRAG